MITITTTVNGTQLTARIPARLLLSDFIRHELGLTGTHVGCEHGVCGACTVLLDGAPIRSCLMLAVQTEGAELTTVEGLAPGDTALSSAQQALGETLSLQCGFCTPGITMSLTAGIREPKISEEALLELLGGHLCRCTGYQGMRAAVRRLAAEATREVAP
jgi:aerobic-type carbon monoxide dehydrogenase small subunit (CoxS/CutS family)